jgi:hypothetical protein
LVEFFVEPGIGVLGIELPGQVRMVVHDRDASDGGREVLGQERAPICEPLFAVAASFVVEQEGLPELDTLRSAVMPPRDRNADRMGSCYRRKTFTYIRSIETMLSSSSGPGSQ